jgi:glycerol-3-phosphate dehydrogenase
VHVVVPRERIGHRAAIVLNAVADGRVMFVIPWGEQSLVGTTDTDHEGGPDTPPTVERSDVDYLLETVNHYFPAARLVRGDVLSAFAGLRPLVAPPSGTDADPSDVSREEEIFVSASGMVTIAGGKLTTYRLIAKAVVDRVTQVLRAGGDTRRFGRCRTGKVPLPGGKRAPEAMAAEAISRDGHGLAPAVIGHLADRYGSRLGEVLGLVAGNRALGAPIAASLPDRRAEVVAAVEQEWALTLEDVLRRRTQIALRDGSSGAAVATDVADLMAGSLGWDAAGTQASARAYVETVEAGRRRWQ